MRDRQHATRGRLEIYLLDMDAVLLHPGGYRAALIATVNHFSTAMGLGEQAPAVEEIEAFEAAGITSEWDSASICIAALLAASAHEYSGGFSDAASALRGDGRRHGPRPDYRALAGRVAAELRRGEYPAEAAYRLLLNDRSSDGLRRPLAELLLYTRDIHRSPVLPVFQQFTLGEAYEATYGLPRTIETESLLLEHDRPALSHPVPPRSAIYTARPSNPPRDVPPRSGMGYAPEAELGAGLVGLSHLPLIGYGSLKWLAETVGGDTHQYVKPSPVHALAAIGAATGALESEALVAAEALTRGDWLSPLKDLRDGRGRVTVFEDSASSIRGVREAVSLLGEGWQCRGIGISAGGPKREALAQVADRVYPSLDAAIEECRGET
ncbi:MAG: hypothetical protein HY023_16770 [Chloroflexi bacterium]|nr:hypothetical protein [Chloroflexota bacterium]